MELSDLRKFAYKTSYELKFGPYSSSRRVNKDQYVFWQIWNMVQASRNRYLTRDIDTEDTL